MNWNEIIEKEKQKPYYDKLYEFVENEYKNNTCYPPFEKILNALNFTSYDDVKCVILGQDPYHGPNQAMGLSFSVEPKVAIPRSLQNIYKELNKEYGTYIPNNGDLTKWAKQGVLLLNTVLTVRAHEPQSHMGKGWEEYTDAIIKSLNEKNKPIVYLLWGEKARAKKEIITNKNHLILETSHPSPYSANRGFFGCNHFKDCNNFLIQHGYMPIDWQIENI